MDKTKEIELECIFCGSTNFEVLYKDYQLKENENIKCSNFNQLNIYEDLLEIAKQKGINEVKRDIGNVLKKL